MPATSQSTGEPTGDHRPDSGSQWSDLRSDYLQERVRQHGSDDDYVALARAQLEAHSRGDSGAMEAAHATLTDGAQSHPGSITILEHLALIESLTGSSDALASTLATLERLDPASEVVRMARDTSPERERQYVERVSAEQKALLDGAGSKNPARVSAALEGLQHWSRTFPSNSTYIINLALGRFSAGQVDGAREAANIACAIEDGSFADAYNLGVIYVACGPRENGVRWLQAALARVSSPEEHALVTDALKQVTGASPAGGRSAGT